MEEILDGRVRISSRFLTLGRDLMKKRLNVKKLTTGKHGSGALKANKERNGDHGSHVAGCRLLH